MTLSNKSLLEVAIEVPTSRGRFKGRADHLERLDLAIAIVEERITLTQAAAALKQSLANARATLGIALLACAQDGSIEIVRKDNFND